jgi:hypothetical protein
VARQQQEWIPVGLFGSIIWESNSQEKREEEEGGRLTGWPFVDWIIERDPVFDSKRQSAMEWEVEMTCSSSICSVPIAERIILNTGEVFFFVGWSWRGWRLSCVRETKEARGWWMSHQMFPVLLEERSSYWDREVSLFCWFPFKEATEAVKKR